MAGLGVCRPEDIALSVLCTVIGRRKDSGNLVVDAGWMALSRDTGLPGRFAREGYGLVCDADGKPLPGLRVAEPIRNTASSPRTRACARPCLWAPCCAFCPCTPVPRPPLLTPTTFAGGRKSRLSGPAAGMIGHLLIGLRFVHFFLHNRRKQSQFAHDSE